MNFKNGVKFDLLIGAIHNFGVIFLVVLLAPNLFAQDYEEISWLDLLPELEREALLNRGPIDHGDNEVAERGPILGGNRSSAFEEKQYEDAWLSSNIRAEYAGESIRLPGFVVPLEYDDEQLVTEFFLVPYFGACIHVPAPPPNQIIHVTIPRGFNLSSIYEPYVIEGEMRIETTANELGISAYSISAENVLEFRK